MWDSLKNKVYVSLTYQDFNIYQKWKTRANSQPPKTCQNISDPNIVDQFIKNSLDLLKSNSKSGIFLGVVITYSLLWFLNCILAKPFYTGSIIALILLWHNIWFDYIWPEICLPGLEHSSPIKKTGFYLSHELNSKLKDIYPIVFEIVECMTKLRSHNKELFCVLSGVFFLTVASIGSVLPGIYWAQILLTAAWLVKLGLQGLGLQIQDMWHSTNIEDLVPELTDDTILVLEKARNSVTQNNESLEDILPADTFGLNFSQTHFETLQLDNTKISLYTQSSRDESDFEEDFEVISSDELSE